MRKFFAIIMVICLVAIALCVPAFAADDAPAAGTVLRVSALKKDGTTIVVIKDYDNFEDGWNAAMELADDSKTMKKNAYDRVVVDIYTDWNAVDGEFTDDWINGDGFENDTIYIPEDVKVTLNLNGHTINRGLTKVIDDGEVMYIDQDADVIINNGTITGGYSEDSAGGIHIYDEANVTLNNVNIVGNNTDDYGAGIAVYDGAVLVMNGGSFKNNVAVGDNLIFGSFGGVVYVDGGSAIFNEVEFKENLAPRSYGAAIYAENGTVAISNCTFDKNGIQTAEKRVSATVIQGDESTITITNSTFINNAGDELFYFIDSELLMEDGSITGNVADWTFDFWDSEADIKHVTITDNASKTIYVDNGNEVVTMVGCTLGNNATSQNSIDVVVMNEETLVFLDCTLGDTTVDDEDYVKVIYSGVAEEDAAISVTKLYKDGTKETTYYRFFEYGWNLAIEAALTNNYDRIIVDLYGDWNAVDGEFTDDFNNGAGFDWDAIYIPANVRVTLNMNGHTINRGLTSNEYNGEVICIDKNADVIINNGTIKGGNSDTGAGGIHIKDGAKVTLNDVNIEGNTTDGDKGAGIAMYNGAVLIMNGGSFTSNLNNSFIENGCGAAIYISNSTATFNNVRFYDNQFRIRSGHGAAVYATQSTVTMDGCEIISNGIYDKINEIYGHGSYSTIHIVGGSTFTIKNTTIKGNGSSEYRDDVRPDQTGNYCSLIRVKDSSQLTIDTCTITENLANYYILDTAYVNIYVLNTTIKDNVTSVFKGHNAEFTNCTFDHNSYNPTFSFMSSDKNVTFTDCNLGDSSFNDRSRAIFDGAAGVGSIFGEGSLSMIVSFAALIASVAAVVVNVSSKKKEVPTTANRTAETEDEEE